MKVKIYLRNNPFLPEGTTTTLDLSQFYKDNSSNKAGLGRWAISILIAYFFEQVP
jgi:hypothetical protein